ncbi:MAG TPA: ABC transporter permease [Vicinamibacteria bacterium]
MRGSLRALWKRATSFRGRERSDRELDEELASHLELHAADNVRAGMSSEEARRAALLKLGGVEQTKEMVRDRRGLPVLDALSQDVRLGLRMMRRSPGFTMAALAVLALGIGANTVMFGVVNTVLLRPLPYPEAARLLRVQTANAEGEDMATAVPDFHEYRARNRTFAALASYYFGSFDLTGGEAPERLRALVVSAEFLGVLGVRPARGRDLGPDDERWGAHRVVVLTDGFWRRRFGGDPALLGQAITLNGEPYTVAGVLPRDFSFLGLEAQALVPMSFAPGDNLNSHNNYFLTMVGRMRPGVPVDAARRDLNAISESIIESHPENRGTHVGMRPLQEAMVGDVRPALLVLFGAVAFVLLITCANLANLILVRAAGRRREVALRIAMGASRGRILRQLLTESVLLAAGGSALALGLAWLSLLWLNSLGQAVLPRTEDVRVDFVVLGFTALVAVATGLLFGLAPALHSVRVDPGTALKESARTAGDPRGHRVRALLVAVEVAMSLVLLIGAGLMLKSMHALSRVDTGFDPGQVLTAQLSLPKGRYVDEALERRFSPRAYEKSARFFDEVVRRARSVPGVTAAGAINGLPLMGEVWGKNATLYDRPLPATLRELPPIQYRVVVGDYFRALGVTILGGRAFSEADTLEGAQVAIINREMARRHWRDADPIGKVIAVNPPIHLVPAGTVPADYEPTRFTIVGVAADVHYGGLQARPVPLVYVPYAQGAEGALTMYLVVRSAGDPRALAPTLRERIREVDPDVAAASIRTMDDRVSAAKARPRLHTVVLGAFAFIALLLAAVGIYGVMSHAAAQRTREIGIRMAVGASSRAILALFMRQGLAMVAAGLVAGMLGAASLTRALRTLLFQVSPTDARVFAAITLLLAAVALGAAWFPARRATRLDPLAALREE